MPFGDHSPEISIGAVLCIVAIVFAPIAYFRCSAATGANVRSAESELKAWAGKLDIKIDGSHISCNSDDSDNDGWSSALRPSTCNMGAASPSQTSRSLPSTLSRRADDLWRLV